VGGISEILPVCVFHSVWKKFGTGCVHEDKLSENSMKMTAVKAILYLGL
jgi:hypothetical protein